MSKGIGISGDGLKEYTSRGANRLLGILALHNWEN